MGPLPRRDGLLLWAVLLLLLLYAVAGGVVSLLPAAVLIDRLGGFSGSGEGGAQIAARYETLRDRARLTTAVLLLGWLVLVWQRHWLGRGLDRVAALGRAVPTWPGRALAASGAAWQRRPWETLAFLVILAGGVVLRLHYLDRDIRHDEAWTYVVYGRRPAYLSPLILTDVNHHPLNTLLMQASVALFGNAVWAIRLPAFLFGVGCIPMAFALALAVGGAGVALITAALVAGASAMIEYSVNARGYAGVSFFALLLLWAGERALRTRRTGLWGLAVLAAAGGVYANIVMVLPGIAAFTWFGWLALNEPGSRRRVALGQVVAAGLGVVLATLFLYVPFFTVNGWDAIAASQGIKARSGALDALALLPAFVAALMADWGRDIWAPAPWVGLVLALGCVGLARGRRVGLAGLLVGVAAALVFQFGLVRDPGPDRVWLSFLPIVALLAAAGLDGILGRLWAGLPGLFAVALLAGMAAGVVRTATLLTSIETGYFPGARTVADSLLGMTARDVLATVGVRGDDIVYYALRHGLVLETIQTRAPMRFYRARGAPDRGDGTLIVVVEKALNFCEVDDCPATATSVVPVRGPLTVVQDTPGWTTLRAPRAMP